MNPCVFIGQQLPNEVKLFPKKHAGSGPKLHAFVLLHIIKSHVNHTYLIFLERRNLQQDDTNYIISLNFKLYKN